jgi:hypothetical protein
VIRVSEYLGGFVGVGSHAHRQRSKLGPSVWRYTSLRSEFGVSTLSDSEVCVLRRPAPGARSFEKSSSGTVLGLTSASTSMFVACRVVLSDSHLSESSV